MEYYFTRKRRELEINTCNDVYDSQSIMLNERCTNCYTLHDSIHMTLGERQNYRDRDSISVYQGLGMWAEQTDCTEAADGRSTLCLDCGGGPMTTHFCQNSSFSTPKKGEFYSI